VLFLLCCAAQAIVDSQPETASNTQLAQMPDGLEGYGPDEDDGLDPNTAYDAVAAAAAAGGSVEELAAVAALQQQAATAAAAAGQPGLLDAQMLAVSLAQLQGLQQGQGLQQLVVQGLAGQVQGHEQQQQQQQPAEGLEQADGEAAKLEAAAAGQGN
jgi:hypothetical protein